MTDWKQAVIEHLPFVLATGAQAPAKMNTTRVLESLIIAGITGAITMYGVQQRLDAQMAEIKAQMAEVKSRIAEDRAEAIRRDLRIEDRIDGIHARNGK